MATVIPTPDGPLSFPPTEEILLMEIEQRLEHLSPEDRVVVEDAMAGMDSLARYHLIESFFVED